MGIAHNCIILIFLLMVSVSRFMVQGRPISDNVRSELVGSMPPRCERRCDSCRQCEPVQVPVQNQKRKTHFLAHHSIAYFRGDAFSNYKPISWKCKCGDLFFNP